MNERTDAVVDLKEPRPPPRKYWSCRKSIMSSITGSKTGET